MLNHDVSNDKLIDAPSIEPLVAEEVKLHTRVDHSAEDSLLEAYIVAARMFCEETTSRALITQTIEVNFDAFPDSCREITIPVAPVQAIDSVKYIDENGDTQTLDPSAYSVSVGNVGRIKPAKGHQWPKALEALDVVKITATVGYGDTSDKVPEVIKQAMRLLVAHFYENREAASIRKIEQAPLAVQALLNLYVWRF